MHLHTYSSRSLPTPTTVSCINWYQYQYQPVLFTGTYHTTPATVHTKSKINISGVFAKNVLWRNTFLPLNEVNSLPIKILGIFALEANKILQATPPRLRREVGMCGNKAKEKKEHHKNKLKKRVRVTTAAKQRQRQQS